MLKHLFIKNYALIDSLAIDFSDGFTTITGETGAGKSILLGALRLVLGERADLKTLKNTEQKCVIEAEFDISKLELESFFRENDLDFEPITILRRDILPSGKSRAFINDVPTTLNVVSELSNKLIDVHSQYDSASIITPDFQFAWIDAMANQTDLVNDFRKNLSDFHTVEKELELLVKQQQKWLEEKELNEFLFEELNDLNLETINLEELEEELIKLENAEQTLLNLSQMSALIEEEPGISLLLNELYFKSKEISNFFKAGNQIQNSIESIRIELQEILRDINSSSEEVEPDPEKLLTVKEQINAVHHLLQKHRKNDISELIELKNKLLQKLNQAIESDDKIKNLENKQNTLLSDLEKISNKISIGRKKIIPNIEKEILTSLSQMGMEKSRIKIQIENTLSFNRFGKDKIDFLFSANPGLELQAMEKSASGGERSRLVLSIKKSLSKHRALPTLILDEIDTGVSGKIAGEMGKQMKEMSRDLQIISITHLPQVAALGHQHYKVIKTVENNITKSDVLILNKDERLKEIAQMISGDNISQAAIDQANQLMK